MVNERANSKANSKGAGAGDYFRAVIPDATIVAGSTPPHPENKSHAATAVPFEWKPGDVILDLYEVERVTEGFDEDTVEKDCHDSGGMGVVYSARDDQIGLIGKNERGETVRADGAGDNNAGEGAAIGAAAGAIGGAAVGAGIVVGVIPVIGPVLALGTLGTILVNAAGGAAIAGIAGVYIF
jgi:hypothetical protein